MLAAFGQFLLRLVFGLAFAMAWTSPRQVTSGYYRNNLYVTLGLATLASLIALSVPELRWGWPFLAGLASFLGAACWLFERPWAGMMMLRLVALCALLGALVTQLSLSVSTAAVVPTSARVLRALAPVTSGLVLGSTMAAMLLGHWYLNSPGMELGPLRRLLRMIAVAVTLQMTVSGLGFGFEWSHVDALPAMWLWFALLRWSFGLVGVLALTWLAWQTLKIPNTQSATGILYVAVVGAFVGELAGLLLSAESLYPL